MQQRKLGTDGPSVGAIGLGCMSFAGAYGKIEEAEAHKTLAAALDLGVTHLDTALIYGGGVSESYIGSFIKDHPNRFTIATKGGIITKPVRRHDNTEASLREQLEGSLKRLGVEHVDLYYIHRRQPEIPIEDVMATMVKFKEEGKIGGIGLSEIAPYTLRRAVAVHPVMAVQNEYSLWTRLPELGLLQACAELGTTFVSFSSVGRGIFADTMPVIDELSQGDFRRSNPRFQEPNYSANKAIVAKFNAYARSQGMSPATMANAWVLQKGDHVIAIPGTRSPEHLAENAAAADTVLSQEQLAEIDLLLPVGFAYGDRYSDEQSVGPERYC
ncbi:aldo/keto reductase [Oricola sp.]|uniref:aldo/keto reductase n=1 Tax=Oricola sp. TaxID=1979950 RepID=UPI0025F49D90|nr:aldo/keto reductase [Oricola sp.]MCI5078487.1 aldo/keto reductase [Oricola sp.]